ncbi:uncharacterized protein LOC110734090 [Chenopodium quinoa]|uniref:uncharacterized protein LOC110734090 n=1 Tax=Chenopodium quinoa TaxID=63459 RepID=UPI000B796D94|nr:uncharacterized protein LOC110734090 [Chenopodium quinoa]
MLLEDLVPPDCKKCTVAMRLIAYGTSADYVDDYIRISASLARGRAPSINYVVNDHQYNMGYYLTDGIYPKWVAFIPTISLPQNEKECLFAKLQEARRKDVKRAFGVLQARFAIIQNPALARDSSMLGKIMIACIIMHNMIVEDERDTYKTYYDPNEYDQATNASSSNRNIEEPFQFENSNNRIASLKTYISNRTRVRDEAMHRALKKDLVEHMLLKFGVNHRQNNLRKKVYNRNLKL